MQRCFLPILILAFLIAGCASKTPSHESPSTTPPATAKSISEQEHTVRTMITGMDQYGDENILVLNSMDASYVIGPNVTGAQLSEIHTYLTEMHDRVITIRYVDKPATAKTLAHKKVIGLEINNRTYELNH